VARITRMGEEAVVMSDRVTRVGTRLSTPPFPALDGMELDLPSLRGTKSLLVMWGSW
jgi:hypothetical protein